MHESVCSCARHRLLRPIARSHLHKMSIGIGMPIDRAISVLQEAGAIRECEKLGWMQDRAD